MLADIIILCRQLNQCGRSVLTKFNAFGRNISYVDVKIGGNEVGLHVSPSRNLLVDLAILYLFI